MSSSAIVLIHGALGSAAQLAPLRGALTGDRPIHVVELDGHGETPPAAPEFAIERFAMSVLAYADAHGLDRVHLFGYSMGGYVALHLAATCPDRVASAATLGTKLAWTPAVAAREVARLDPITIRTKVPKFAEALERRHAGAGGWELVLSKTAALMTSLGARPAIDTSVLTAIRQPTRLMVGDRDNVVSIDETVSAARTLPRGECCVLPNIPHPIEQVRVPLLDGALCDFYESIPD